MTAPRLNDVAVIGGGIVGLATAAALIAEAPNLRVVVLEKEECIGAHQTGRNSGVMHSGVYYKPGSAKARLCVSGVHLLRKYCDARGIRVQRVGKVIVATSREELPRLDTLLARGTANGCGTIVRIGASQLREIEPHAAGIAALYLPDVNVVRFIDVAQALALDIDASGGSVLTNARVGALRRAANGCWHIETTRGEVTARTLVNCAGLAADHVARLAGAQPAVRIVPFRGEYYDVVPGRADLIRGLVYPVPDPRFPFLGVHFTRRIGGTVEAGPNAVLALAREGYSWRKVHGGDIVDMLAWPGFARMVARHWRTGMAEAYRSVSKEAFVRSLQRLVPEIQSDDLVRGGSGVRAQAVGQDGRLIDDFHLLEQPGALHVLNAPSPAATASLAIGQHLARTLIRR